MMATLMLGAHAFGAMVVVSGVAAIDRYRRRPLVQATAVVLGLLAAAIEVA
jgi:hypothetical protein